MPSLVGSVTVNLLVWGLTYIALSRRTVSPFIHFYGLAAVSAIGAAVVSDSFSLPVKDYVLVVAAPMVLTIVVTLRSAMRQRASTGDKP